MKDTHYELNVAPHLAWARSYIKKREFHTLTDLQLEIVQKRPAALVGLLSAWAAMDPDLDGSLSGRFGTDGRGFAVYSSLLDIAEAIGSPNAQGEAMTQTLLSWATARFDKGGRRTFTTSSGLAQRLLLTELRGIKGTDVKVPYPTLYIDVPTELGFQIPNLHTGWHTVNGVYVIQDRHEGLDGIRLLICAGANGASTNRFDDALSHFFIPLLDESLDDRVLGLQEVWDKADDETLEEWARARGLPDGLDDRTKMTEHWLGIFRWVLNVLFYVTSPDCEREHIEANEAARKLWARIQKLPNSRKNKKRARLVEEHRALQKKPRELLGASVKLDRSMPTTSAEKSAGTGKALTVRTLVVGHWQRFAVGKGRKDRVWKFRAPFWRGPVDAPESSTHVHELDSDEGEAQP